MTDSVVVVAAVVEKHGAFLVTRRPEGAHLAGLWEFPGGKIGPAESHEDGLRREMREELDADVEVHELLFTTVHPYADRSVALFFYRCVLKQDPRPLLGQDMRWVEGTDLRALDFPPADEQLVTLLVERSRLAARGSQREL